MKKTVFLLMLCASMASTAGAEPRWSKEQAQHWYAQQSWPVGCNFIPSTAINQLEMWQADTFDPTTIDRELGYAEKIGMNTVRVFLHNLPWEEDQVGFKGRIDRFLEISHKHHIKVIFVLFDSCWNDDPKSGKQPAPQLGVHNSGWVRSPGSKKLFDARTWGPLESYVKGILSAYKDDSRVLCWDLFNEPSNSGYHDAVMPLLTKTFAWAKQVNPSQPLTAGPWEDHPLSTHFMLDNSDIVTFHDYQPPQKLEAEIQELGKLGRPMICTEYMARPLHSTFQDCLPVFHRYHVGGINWGLVKGKTNTIFQWDHPLPTVDEPPVWFHDIFRPDGTPFSQTEVDFIKRETSR